MAKETGEILIHISSTLTAGSAIIVIVFKVYKYFITKIKAVAERDFYKEQYAKLLDKIGDALIENGSRGK